jgi:hypothetical protein
MIVLDVLLGWTAGFSSAAAVSIVGVISGAAVMVVQKFCSRQAFLRSCKEDLRTLKRRIREAKKSGDRDAAARLRNVARRISGRYFWGALKPALVTIPVIGCVAWWADARLAYRPFVPDDVIEVRAHFEDGGSGFAYLMGEGGLQAEGPAIAPVEVPRKSAEPAGVQARWKLRATSAGSHLLRVRHSDRSYEISIPVGGPPPSPVTVFQTESPTRDQLQAVELRLTPSLPSAWWTLGWGWMGLYLWTAAAAALAFRFAFRVQ